MAQIQKLIQENQKLKYQLEKFKSSNGLLPYVDDSLFKGGYRVVKTITDRDNIDCCHSKQGMIVCVIGEDLSFKEYRLISDCKNKQWEKIQTQVTENDVILVEDYSELSENLTTQKELNLILKQLILNLQTQIDNIELIDKKVQITENTNFTQVGQSQKDFNKNVSDYKTNSDLKNQEQDSRLENLEGINYTWSPTNRTLTLFDSNGTQLSQVSLVSLDNEGTDLRYNATTLSLDLYNSDNELLDSIPVSSFIGSVGTQLQLNSNQLQLRDSQGNILSTVSFIVSNIQGLQTALDGKLNKPTTTGNTASYPYVVGEDGNGNSARLPAGDLGKNFFNSDLSNTTARNHTMNAGVTVNTLGNPHTLSGLPNKNADIANFRKVRVQNTSGLDAVVDSKNLLTDGVTSMTDAEKDAWRLAQRKTGENYSTGQPQPFAAFPPIVENSNEIQEIVVVGSNLFLNNQSLGTALVSLVSEDTGTEYPLNVEVNQINPSVLSFGYNFSTLPLGNYWVKIIHNGLVNINKVYIQVLDNIINEPLPNLSWTGFRLSTNTYFTDANNTSGFVSFTPTAINFTRKYDAANNAGQPVERSAYINSSAFNLPNDFYLEFSGTCPWQTTNSRGGRQPTISMGLSAYNSTFDISNTYIAGFGLATPYQNSVLLSDTYTTLNMGDVTNFVFYVIKRGSKIVLGLKSKSGLLYSTYTAPLGNQFMIKLNHFEAYGTTQDTLISFALTKILSL